MFSAVALPVTGLAVPAAMSDSGSESEQVVIGIAQDAAFGFYYRECAHQQLSHTQQSC